MEKEEIKIAVAADKIVDVHPSEFKKSIYKYFALFEHMADEHNLTLLESELQQIYRIVNNDLDSENQQLLQELRKTQAQYECVVQQNKELQQDLIHKNNLLIAKDAKIASMQKACDPQIIEDACSFVHSLFEMLEKEKITVFKFADETVAELKRIGNALNDYQEGKPNPFADDYFRNLTYANIAELAKKSIRLTTENCEMQHKIEDYIENQCSNCEETSEHCEFCDIQDLKKIIGGEDDTAN